jgi:K+-sensing histidine kinase KdpD
MTIRAARATQPTPRRRWFVLPVAVVAPVVAVVAMIPLRDHVENANLALALVVVVLLVAVVGGRSAGIVASLSTALAFDAFLTRPFNSLRITTWDDLQTTLLLGLIGLIAGELVERARRSAAAAARTQATLDALYQHAELAAGSESPGRLLGLVMDELTELLDLKSCRFVPGPLPTPMPELMHNGILVPGDVQPTARGLVALPVRAHGQLQGNLVMAFPTTTVGATLTADQRNEAVALADQLGVGLLRFHDQPMW